MSIFLIISIDSTRPQQPLLGPCHRKSLNWA